MCIDEVKVEDIINVSREAHAVGLWATGYWHPMPLANSDNVEAFAQRLEQDLGLHHAVD